MKFLKSSKKEILELEEVHEEASGEVVGNVEFLKLLKEGKEVLELVEVDEEASGEDVGNVEFLERAGKEM